MRPLKPPRKLPRKMFERIFQQWAYYLLSPLTIVQTRGQNCVYFLKKYKQFCIHDKHGGVLQAYTGSGSYLTYDTPSWMQYDFKNLKNSRNSGCFIIFVYELFNYLVHKTIGHSFFRTHKVVSVSIFFNFFKWLPGLSCKNLI